MDFSLSEEQEMLRTMARDFLTAACPKQLVRDMVEDERGYPPELWKQIAELGWTGLVVPEEYGGIGGSLLDLAVLLEETGRACLPGPFFSTAVLGGLSLIEAGNEAQKREFLPKLVQGDLMLTLALTEPNGKYAADAIQTEATPDSKDGFTIQGTKLFVTDAHIADYIICVARTKYAEKSEDGMTLFLVEDNSPCIKRTVLKTISGDKQCEVIFDNLEVSGNNILGEINKGWYHLQKIMEKATIARCAEMLGGARQVLTMTIDYAKDRVQFGHPIGSFQVIQHALADMFIEVDACALVIYDAAWRLSQGLPAGKDVSMAKALISETFTKAATSAHQIHGAIGFTEDHDLPLYFKRAKAWELSLGNAYMHLDKIATATGI